MWRLFQLIVGLLIVVALTAILISPDVSSAPTTLHGTRWSACVASPSAVVAALLANDLSFFSERLEVYEALARYNHPTVAVTPLLC
jgi:hypothetical protein